MKLTESTKKDFNMPYIPSDDRKRWNHPLSQMEAVIQTGGISNGDFNYIISRLCQMYIDKHTMCYSTASDVVKTLECAKLEFYRRVLVPYEDKKIGLNGDVYTITSGWKR